MSQGMSDNLRSRKEYKTCLRLCKQVLVALWILLLDVCFKVGVLFCSDALMQMFGISPQSDVSDPISLLDLTNLIQAAALQEDPIVSNF